MSAGTWIGTIALLLAALDPNAVVPPPGTVLTGRIDDAIDSRRARTWEPFTVSAVSADDRSVTRGKVFGHVTKVVPAGPGKRAEIDVAFDTLITNTGREYPLQARARSGMIPFTMIPALALGGVVIAKNVRDDVVIPAHATIEMEVVSVGQEG